MNPVMNHRLDVQVMTITPTLAQDLLQSNNMNRPLNKRTVQDYVSQMRKGLWTLNGEPIIVSSEGKLLDGQHRLEACSQSGVSFETLLVRGVPEESFTTIDTGRIRTAGDIFSIVGIPDYNSKSGIISRYFTLVKGDANFNVKEGLRAVGISKTESLRFYLEHKELIDQINQISLKCYSKGRLFSRGIIGGYMLYLTVNKFHPFETVQDFFMELFGVKDSTNTCTVVLRDTLLRHITGQRVITPTLRHVYITKAWNAYVTGRQLKSLTYNKDKEGTIHMI